MAICLAKLLVKDLAPPGAFVVEPACHHRPQPVTPVVLPGQFFLSHLAHGIRPERAEWVCLLDGQLLRANQPVFLAGASDVDQGGNPAARTVSKRWI